MSREHYDDSADYARKDFKREKNDWKTKRHQSQRYRGPEGHEKVKDDLAKERPVRNWR